MTTNVEVKSDEAIRIGLDREEKTEKRNRETDDAWEDYKQSRRGVNHDAMTAWFESWGTEKETQCPEPKTRY